VKPRERIKGWYEGEYEPPDNPPGGAIVFAFGQYRRHWSSRLAHVVVDFYLKEWRWLLPFLVAVISVIAAVAKLARS
jgi:hypothetical protein